MIDGVGPFFRADRINWSKIPFDQIEYEGLARQAYFARIREDFESFCRRVSAIAVSLVWHAFKRARPDRIPKFARKSAMGIDTIFH